IRVRDEIVRELQWSPRASRLSAFNTNLRYAVLARLRGRKRMRCVLFRKPVDRLLADATCELLNEVGHHELRSPGAVASISRLLPFLAITEPATDWAAARRAILREWPDAHPLAAQ